MEDVLQRAVSVIEQRLGLPMTGSLVRSGGSAIEIHPKEGHPNETFKLIWEYGFRTTSLKIVPGNFAAPMIKQMGLSFNENWGYAKLFTEILDARGSSIQFKVNGSILSISDVQDVPQEWDSFELFCKSPLMVLNQNDLNQINELVENFLLPAVGIIVSLVGLEEAYVESLGETEGNSYESITRRYERKKVNREACIQLKGYACLVCGFDFKEAYGELGADYVEVHHVVPVSKMGSNYRVNIESDLVPLCSNCHSMVHRKDPPLSVEELKAALAGKPIE